MRFVAPARGDVDVRVFARPPLAQWAEYRDLLQGVDWPAIDELNARWPSSSPFRFVAQNQVLLADGLHYERRIAERGLIATREANWHDLFNALIWLRYTKLKQSLNAQQVAEIAVVGDKQRSRVQCALTHFDEAGVVVGVRDLALLALWDAHDWHALFWRERAAWSDGRIVVALFGHALLEHALEPAKLLVGKALVCALGKRDDAAEMLDRAAQAIGAGECLRDPQDLRPLPLSGIPGWHLRHREEQFYLQGECFQPLRPGRRYPSALSLPRR